MDFMIENVRLAFPVLWTPKEFTAGDGKPRYSAAFLIAPGSAADQAIESAINKEIAEKFPDPAKATAFRLDVEGQKNGWCYMLGDRKSYSGYAGMKVLSTHRKASDGRPLIIDANKAALTEIDGKPYAGCYVNAKVSIYVQTTGEQRGVRASFGAIQFAGAGEPFTGATQASVDEFKDLSQGTDTPAIPPVRDNASLI